MMPRSQVNPRILTTFDSDQRRSSRRAGNSRQQEDQAPEQALAQARLALGNGREDFGAHVAMTRVAARGIDG